MTDRFDIIETPLRGLVLVRRRLVGDSRGHLERMFCADELRGLLGGDSIAQINRTFTARRGAVRGLHYQRPPHAETKFVSCLQGRVFDVAVDLRKGSPTFLQSHAEVLEPGAHTMLVIPKGFAHGFQTLSESCEMLYFHTAPYRADAEGAVNARDPRLGVAWPEEISELSDRDASHPMLAPDFGGIAT